MERKWISVLMVVVSFAAGFGICYRIYGPGQARRSMANDVHPPLKIALITGPATGQTSPEVRPEGELDWEPYLIQPTLPPKVIERYRYMPQKPTAEPNGARRVPTIRIQPIPTK